MDQTEPLNNQSDSRERPGSAQEGSLETEQVVVFKLQNEEYAAPILAVQEIIPTGEITPFPNATEYVAGIINVRGTVATVINLSRRFGLQRGSEENKDQYTILTYVDRSLFGLMVDEVTSVMKIPRVQIRPATQVGESSVQADYVDGVAVVDERVILILNLQKILDDESIMTISRQASNI